MRGLTETIIDAETGDELNGAYHPIGLWFFTSEQWSAANEFAQNYRKLAFTPEQWEENKEEAQEQGHWELWQRLKAYTGQSIPENVLGELIDQSVP